MKIFIFSSFFMMNVFTLFSQTKGIILDAYDTPINEVAIFFPDQNILIYNPPLYNSLINFCCLKIMTGQY